MYAIVLMPSAVMCVLSAAMILPRPKSEILQVPSWARRQLQVFISRWAILLLCSMNSPLAMSWNAFLPLQKNKISDTNLRKNRECMIFFCIVSYQLGRRWNQYVYASIPVSHPSPAWKLQQDGSYQLYWPHPAGFVPPWGRVCLYKQIAIPWSQYIWQTLLTGQILKFSLISFLVIMLFCQIRFMQYLLQEQQSHGKCSVYRSEELADKHVNIYFLGVKRESKFVYLFCHWNSWPCCSAAKRVPPGMYSMHNMIPSGHTL